MPPATTDAATGVTPSKVLKAEDNYFDDIFLDIMITTVEPPSPLMERAKKEVKLFLTLPVTTNPQALFSHLGWWKQYESQLPLMARVAKSILCTPATSSPSERLFSKAGMLINKKRANLKLSKVDMMLYLNTNYMI